MPFYLRVTSISIATLVLTLTSLTRAQSTVEPSEPSVEPSVVARVAEPIENPPRLDLSRPEDPRGNVGASIVGGVVGLGASLLVGKLVYAYGVRDCTEEDGAECGYGSGIEAAITTMVAAPWLAATGVFLGGKLTGGTGGYGWTLLGGAAAALPVIGIAALLALLPSRYEPFMTVAVIGVPIAFIVGASLGYRWSADDFDASLAVAPDGRGAQLTFSGAL